MKLVPPVSGVFPPLKFNSKNSEKWCLEDDPFLLGRSLSRGELLNFGRVSGPDSHIGT